MLKRWLREERLAALVLLLGQLSAAGGAVLVNIFAARVLDPADRGDLAFGLQIAYFLTVFALMGVQRPYMASREGEFNQEYRNFSHLVLPGAILIIPVTLLVLYFSPLGEKWFVLGIVAVVVYTVLNALSRGVRVGYVVSGNWKRFAFNALGSQVVIVLGSILFLVFEVDSPELWMAVYTISTLPAVLMLIDAHRGKYRGEKLEPEERKILRRKGLVLLPSDFSNTAMMRIDRLLLPILSSSAALGLYVTVATVMEMVSWPIKQWVDASLRKWAKTGEAMVKALNRILIKAFFFVTVLAAVLGIAAYAMIYLILPDAYMNATTAIIPLAVGSIIHGLTRVQQGFLVAIGATARVSIIEIIGTVASVIAFLFLIPPFGMLGAAYGSIIGFLVCFLAGYVILLGFKREQAESK